jgi:hypothetical protein
MILPMGDSPLFWMEQDGERAMGSSKFGLRERERCALATLSLPFPTPHSDPQKYTVFIN